MGRLLIMHSILYAEDEEDDVFFVTRAFKQAGIMNPLVVVPDGQAAIDYLAGSGQYSDRAKHPLPCLALLDINMPAKSGLEVLTWIRRELVARALPVIVFSSSSQEKDIQLAYTRGTNGYLVKPGKPEDLVVMAKAIKDYWLNHNRALPESREQTG